MDEEYAAINQLGGFALGNLLSDLGVEGGQPADMQRLGLGGGSAGFEQNQIYKEEYADDDDEELARYGLGRGEDGASDAGRGGETDGRADMDRYYRQGMEQVGPSAGHVRGEVDDFDDEDNDADAGGDAEELEMPRFKEEPWAHGPLEALRAESPPRRDVKEIWPGFEHDAVLNFTELFASRPAKRRRLVNRPPKFRIVPDEELPVPPSTRETILHPARLHHHQPYVRQVAGSLLEPAEASEGESDEEWDRRLQVFRRGPALPDGTHLHMIELDDWEDRIVWEAGPDSRQPIQSRIDRPFNHELASGSWLKSIIWQEGAPYRDFTQLVLDLNDPEMMLETESGQPEKVTSLVRVDAPAVSQRAARAVAELDLLNLSNDRFYEMSREHRTRIRQTLGQLVVQHAWPAMKLQLPFYKTRLTKAEARSFHRPAMQFPSNIPLSFSKVRSSRKKKDDRGKSKKAKDPSEVLHSTRDLTLKDTSSFVLYEYSEEYPPIMSNLGMGSLLVNYYRKKDPKDEHIPKMDIGEPFVLDVADESPFMKFGTVEPGQTMPTLYNNLIRAPLFRHKPKHTDFLLIRSTTKDEIKYYLREIKTFFLVGQTYPTTPVPGPHARLVTNTIKNRLQMIAFKLIQSSKGERIKIHRLMKYFPDQNELQMRQRLKEFMEYNRKRGDPNQGFWKLKPHVIVPDDSELLKLVPPEHVCLCESMQVGQRHLLDAGYTKSAEGADEEGDESKMDVEQLLAPWITTKNFLNATQGKAMLKLHGEGDPSGRGEAFSFIRVSMKEIFIRAGDNVDERLAAAEAEARSKSGHKYNVAEQQAVYRSEVLRIWNAQCKALSDPVPPELTPEDEKPPPQAPTPSASGGHATRANSRADSIRRDRSPSAMSRVSTPDPEAGSQAGQDPNAASKVLKIRRMIGGKWQTEVVRDAAVINAYVRQRQRIEDENTATEALVPTDDAAMNASRRKRLEEQIEKMKKNQERRLQRKNAKAAAEGLAIPGGYKKLLNKTETKRKCGRCGQIGHMSTNTSCPQYPGNAGAGTGGPGTPTSATGPGPGPGAPGHTPRGSISMPSSSFYAPGQSPLSAVPPSPIYPGFGAATPLGPGLSAGLDSGGMYSLGGPPPAQGAGSPPAPGTPASGSGASGAGGGGGGSGGGLPKLKLKLKDPKT